MKKTKFLTVLSAAVVGAFLIGCDGNVNGGATGSRYEATLTFDSGEYYDSVAHVQREGYWERKVNGTWETVAGRTQSFTVKKGVMLSRVWNNIFMRDGYEYRPAIYGYTYEHKDARQETAWKLPNDDKLTPSNYRVESDERFTMGWDDQGTVTVTYGLNLRTPEETPNEVQWTSNAINHNLVKYYPGFSTWVGQEVTIPFKSKIGSLLTYDKAAEQGVPAQIPAIDNVTKEGTYDAPDIAIDPTAVGKGWKFDGYTFKASGTETEVAINPSTFEFTVPGKVIINFIRPGQASSFADTSWTDIVAKANEGYEAFKERFINDYNANNHTFVGLKHNVNVYEDQEKLTPKVYTVSVIGECIDDIVNTESGEATGEKATLTLQFDDLVESSIGWAVNPHGQKGGYANDNANSNVRKYLKSNFPSQLTPTSEFVYGNDILKYSDIKTVKKTTMKGYNSNGGTVETENNNEKFFALSVDEMDYIAAENLRITNADYHNHSEPEIYAREGRLYPYYDTYNNYSGYDTNPTTKQITSYHVNSTSLTDVHTNRINKSIVDDQGKIGEPFDAWTRSPVAETQGAAYSVVQKEYKEGETTVATVPYIEWSPNELDSMKDVDRAAGVAPAFCLGSTVAEQVPTHTAKLIIPANSQVIKKVIYNGTDYTPSTEDVVIELDNAQTMYNNDNDITFKVITNKGYSLGSGFMGLMSLVKGGSSEGISPFQFTKYGGFDLESETYPKYFDFTLPLVYDYTGSNEDMIRSGFISCTADATKVMAYDPDEIEYDCTIPSEFMVSNYKVTLNGVSNEEIIYGTDRSESCTNNFHIVNLDPFNNTLPGQSTKFLATKMTDDANITNLKVFKTVDAYSDSGSAIDVKDCLQGDDNIKITEVEPAAGSPVTQWTIEITAQGSALSGDKYKELKVSGIRYYFDYVTSDEHDPTTTLTTSTEFKDANDNVVFTVDTLVGSMVKGNSFSFILKGHSDETTFEWERDPSRLVCTRTISGTASNVPLSYAQVDSENDLWLFHVDGQYISDTIEFSYNND